MTGPDWTERFWAKVDKNGPVPAHRPELGSCWLWTASVNVRHGYGQFRMRPRTLRAHVVAYETMIAPVPRGLELDHLCRIRRCVNPAHLEPVTRRLNFLRGDHPTAVSVRENRCYRGHELTPENTITKPGRPGKRECRRCDNAGQRRRHAERSAA